MAKEAEATAKKAGVKAPAKKGAASKKTAAKMLLSFYITVNS